MELVDTDVLIDVQRGFRTAEEWFATSSPSFTCRTAWDCSTH